MSRLFISVLSSLRRAVEITHQASPVCDGEFASIHYGSHGIIKERAGLYSVSSTKFIELYHQAPFPSQCSNTAPGGAGPLHQSPGWLS